MAVSANHNLGSIIKDNIKCSHCTQRRAIQYGSGVLYCWNCRLAKLTEAV